MLLDGAPVMSCLVPVETVDGAAVRTLEGVPRPDGELDEVQAAFLEGFATQCGFCTSGMIMAAEALLAANPDPSREDVVRAISGNVCRCTGYESIINAILDAAAAPRRAWSGRSVMAIQTEQLDQSYFAGEREDDFDVIGTPVQRSDALGHVTGRTEFFEDVHPPGLLHLKMHRSERHHALLKDVDRRAGAARSPASCGSSPTRTCRTTGTRSCA